MRVTRWVLAAAATLALATGCGTSGTTSSSSSSSSSAPAMSAQAGTGTLEVFAAASLKQSFTTIGEQFQTANPGTKIDFNFAGSSDLVTQLSQGAKADVFASADTKNMDKAKDAQLLAGAPVDFATNVLTIAVAPDNPKGIASFRDLTKNGLDVVVCAPQVPCGSATEKVEKDSGVLLRPVSEESSVTDVLNKVSTGQADAGVVYVTDVAGAKGKVKGVDFPESKDAVNTYPIATLQASANTALAKKFVDFVAGDAGRQVLASAGFGKP